MSYSLIDLFSGAGGMSLGFVDPRFCGGFKSVWALDNDLPATRTFVKKIGKDIECGDIELSLGEGRAIPKADVVIGGPPCQGFSLLNKRRTGDARRALWQPFMDIVQRSHAKIFVVENVAELYSSPEREAIEDRAAELGYVPPPSKKGQEVQV